MRLSLATRIFVGYAVVLLTFGAVALFSISELRRNQLESRLDGEGYLVLVQMTASIETFQKNQAQNVARLKKEPNVETRRAHIMLERNYYKDSMTERLSAAIATAKRARTFSPETEAPFLADLESRYVGIGERYAAYRAEAESAFTLFEQPTLDDAEVEVHINALQQLENALSASIRLVQASLEARLRDRVRQSQERERRTGVAIIGLSVLAIVVGLLATGIASRSLRPVRTLIDGVARIREGDFSTTLGVQGDDEIAVLAREFDSMAKALTDRDAQLKAKQEALLHAEQLAAMGRVSAQVAHEVRNPLSSIGLNVEMLGDLVTHARFDDAESSTEARTLLANVTREVDRLTEITDDYLRLARLPSPTMRREDLVGLIDGILGFSAEELERASVKVTRNFEVTEAPVDCDEGQLRQVLLNLVRNSREAMSTGGTLTLGLRATPARYELRIIDTGAGIPLAARAKIFEPFFTTKQGGTGLGLPLSRQIVEAHGGVLTLEDAPAGTTFLLTLPRT